MDTMSKGVRARCMKKSVPRPEIVPFYMRKKVQIDLTEKDKVLQRSGTPEW